MAISSDYFANIPLSRCNLYGCHSRIAVFVLLLQAEKHRVKVLDDLKG